MLYKVPSKTYHPVLGKRGAQPDWCREEVDSVSLVMAAVGAPGGGSMLLSGRRRPSS